MTASQNSREPVTQDRRRKSPKLSRRKQSGYAYIMALFMVLAVIAGSQIVLRNLVTEARSQREAEMIWRGNQYVRAVKMYYRKTGHYPQSQGDLLTGVPGLHFIRSEALKDPIDKDNDGKWRFIYTSAGAIIGSVKYGSLQQMALMDMNGGQMPGTQTNSGSSNSTSQSSSSDSNTSNSTTQGGNTTQGSNTAPTTGAPGQSNGLFPTTASTFGSAGQPAGIGGPQPTGPVDGPVFGGQIIGVGSMVDRASVRVYKGGKKYKDWEFIWNPIEEQAQAVQGLVSGAGTPGLGLPGLPLGPTNGMTGPSTGTNTTSGTNGNSNNSGGTNASPNPTQ